MYVKFVTESLCAIDEGNKSDVSQEKQIGKSKTLHFPY